MSRTNPVYDAFDERMVRAQLAADEHLIVGNWGELEEHGSDPFDDDADVDADFIGCTAADRLPTCPLCALAKDTARPIKGAAVQQYQIDHAEAYAHPLLSRWVYVAEHLAADLDHTDGGVITATVRRVWLLEGELNWLPDWEES